MKGLVWASSTIYCGRGGQGRGNPALPEEGDPNDLVAIYQKAMKEANK